MSASPNAPQNGARRYSIMLSGLSVFLLCTTAACIALAWNLPSEQVAGIVQAYLASASGATTAFLGMKFGQRLQNQQENK